MAKRAAAPTPDTRPRILRLVIMTLGTLLLAAGSLAAVVMIGVLISNGVANFARVGYTQDSEGGAILALAAVGVVLGSIGWNIFLNGLLGPRKAAPNAPVRDDPSELSRGSD